MNKKNVVSTHSFKLFYLKKEILIHATSGINLENIILAEINQSQKDKYFLIPLTAGTENRHIHRDKVKQRSSVPWE